MSRSQRPTCGEESGELKALETRDLTLGEALGKYRLLGALGHGGMADVYLAVADGPEGFRKLCVIKLLKESMALDEEFRAMFLDEARLAARLNHPNVVQTFEVGELGGRLMLAMEYVEGQPATRVRSRLPAPHLPLTAWIRVLCDVLEALEYAHTLSDFDGSVLGIVHRDVSPHNILLGYDGRVKLVDFGIAKSSAAEQLTQAGVLKGKVGYMAPEQATLGDVDGRADIFSVGVILWETIANRRLIEGLSSNDVILRRAAGEDPKIADVVPEVDPELAAICDRAMARNPADRFATAADFQTELELWLTKHGEPSRKGWAKMLRDAFTTERDQLRSLVEQRMTTLQNAGISASYSKLLTSTGTHSLTPGKQPPSSSTKHLGGIASVTIPPPDSPSAETLLAPGHDPAHTVVSGARPRHTTALLLGVAASVVVGVGAAAYVVSAHVTASTQPPPAVEPPPAAESQDAVVPPSTASSITSPVTATADPPAAASVSTPVASPATRQVTAPPVRPPNVHRPPAHPAPPASSTTAAATTPAHPPTKPPSRPLDEKDPYAP